jgi:hypothetical protein
MNTITPSAKNGKYGHAARRFKACVFEAAILSKQRPLFFNHPDTLRFPCDPKPITDDWAAGALGRGLLFSADHSAKQTMAQTTADSTSSSATVRGFTLLSGPVRSVFVAFVSICYSIADMRSILK